MVTFAPAQAQTPARLGRLGGTSEARGSQSQYAERQHYASWAHVFFCENLEYKMWTWVKIYEDEGR